MVIDIGKPTPEELRLDFHGRDYPDEAHVIDMASQWSINPQELEEFEPGIEPGIIGKYG